MNTEENQDLKSSALKETCPEDTAQVAASQQNSKVTGIIEEIDPDIVICDYCKEKMSREKYYEHLSDCVNQWEINRSGKEFPLKAPERESSWDLDYEWEREKWREEERSERKRKFNPKAPRKMSNKKIKAFTRSRHRM